MNTQQHQYQVAADLPDPSKLLDYSEPDWGAMVRAALPDSVKAYTVHAMTSELVQLTAGFSEAWSLWNDANCIGVLARGESTWMWAEQDLVFCGDRTAIILRMQSAIKKTKHPE